MIPLISTDSDMTGWIENFLEFYLNPDIDKQEMIDDFAEHGITLLTSENKLRNLKEIYKDYTEILNKQKKETFEKIQKEMIDTIVDAVIKRIQEMEDDA